MSGPPRQLRVDETGPLCTVQDLGRTGLSALGVGRSGAADRGALITANRLVGNGDGEAALEVTLGGLRVTATADLVLGIAGAAVPLSVDRVPVDGPVVELGAGRQLRLGRPRDGLRTYLSVSGGVDVPGILGSRSTDTLSGIGPEPLARGRSIPVGDRVGERRPDTGPPVTTALELVPGPREDWFVAGSLERLIASGWTVGAAADRVAMHLEGPELVRSVHRELPSEPMVPGALQVPPSGRPVLFLADHPVTGGYPVIAVLTVAAVDRAAQLRPGRTLHFRRAGTEPS